MTNKRTNRVMTQESHLKGELRRFEIYNEKFLKINIHNVFGDKAYHLNMDILEPWPILQRQISPRWLLSLVYFGGATLIYSIYLLQHPDRETLGHLIPFIFLFILLTLGSLLMFLYQSPNVMEFRSRYGGCVLVGLLKNKPNKEDFKHFTDELKTRVLAASQAITLDKPQMIEFELQELQRLVEEGIVSEAEYNKAKNRIKKINFEDQFVKNNNNNAVAR